VLINSIEMLTLFVLVLSLWTTLWLGQRRGSALRPVRVASATDADRDAGMHLCRRGVGPLHGSSR
jgi:hypothetical protein